MPSVIETLKETWHPASLPSMLLFFGIGVLLLYVKGLARWGRRWLGTLVVGYWFLATPFGSRVASLPLVYDQQRLENPAQAVSAQAIVLLGGGIVTQVADGFAIDDPNGSALRIIEAARVYKLLGDPLVIASGGSLQHLQPPRSEAGTMRRMLIGLGVPPSRVIVEEGSLTTRDQALLVKGMLAERRIDHFVLVTSAIHMRRSMATFRAVGLDPIPSASRVRNQRNTYRLLVPNRESLLISDAVAYDGIAWLYYWAHGWTKAAGHWRAADKGSLK